MGGVVTAVAAWPAFRSGILDNGQALRPGFDTSARAECARRLFVDQNVLLSPNGENTVQDILLIGFSVEDMLFIGLSVGDILPIGFSNTVPDQVRSSSRTNSCAFRRALASGPVLGLALKPVPQSLVVRSGPFSGPEASRMSMVCNQEIVCIVRSDRPPRSIVRCGCRAPRHLLILTLRACVTRHAGSTAGPSGHRAPPTSRWSEGVPHQRLVAVELSEATRTVEAFEVEPA